MIKAGVLSPKADSMAQQIKYYSIFGLTKSGLSSGSRLLFVNLLGGIAAF